MLEEFVLEQIHDKRKLFIIYFYFPKRILLLSLTLNTWSYGSSLLHRLIFWPLDQFGQHLKNAALHHIAFSCDTIIDTLVPNADIFTRLPWNYRMAPHGVNLINTDWKDLRELCFFTSFNHLNSRTACWQFGFCQFYTDMIADMDELQSVCVIKRNLLFQCSE